MPHAVVLRRRLQGGEKYVEARYAFQELIDKFGASVSLLNALASAHIALGQFEEAERLLIDAIGKVQPLHALG